MPELPRPYAFLYRRWPFFAGALTAATMFGGAAIVGAIIGARFTLIPGDAAVRKLCDQAVAAVVA